MPALLVQRTHFRYQKEHADLHVLKKKKKKLERQESVFTGCQFFNLICSFQQICEKSHRFVKEANLKKLHTV